jgi:hypothetical protein
MNYIVTLKNGAFLKVKADAIHFSMQNCHGFSEENEMRGVARLTDGAEDVGMFFVDGLERIEQFTETAATR